MALHWYNDGRMVDGKLSSEAKNLLELLICRDCLRRIHGDARDVAVART